MKLGFTLHQILTGKDRKSLPIGSVQEFEDKAFADLLKVGAVREPSEAEATIFESQNGKPAAKKATAKAEKATAKADKASADKAQEGDGNTTDPDEVEEI